MIGLSLVIPLKNEESSVEILIDSIVKQSYQPAEIILVDGGSTDNTVALIRKLTGTDNRFLLIEAGPASPGKGRNIGAGKATSEWIAFTDAGICLDRDWLKNLVNKAEEEPSADIVYGNFSPQVNNFFEKCATITYVRPLKEGKIRDRFIASSLLRKKVWEQIDGFPDWRATEDLVFMDRAEQNGFKATNAPAAVVHWQLQPTFASTYKRFDLYSKYNVWSGRQAEWQYPVARQYAMLLLAIMLGIFHSPYWLLVLPVWLMARVGRRIFMHRFQFGIKEIFNPMTYLGVSMITFTMDLGTFTGWIKAVIHGKE